MPTKRPDKKGKKMTKEAMKGKRTIKALMGMNKKRESEMTSIDVIAEAILRIQKRPKS